MPSITAGELAKLVGGTLSGNDMRVLSSVLPLESATEDSVSFLANVRYHTLLEQTNAGVVFVSNGISRASGDYITTKDPYTAFVIALEFFSAQPKRAVGVHPSAVIDPTARIGEGVSIGPNCIVESGSSVGDRSVLIGNTFVGKNVSVGSDCVLHAQVSVRFGSVLGNRVIVHCGTVIGSDGFGFAPDQGKFRKIPQIGIVVIEDDVEIGANTTIDRATMGETRIGEGTKIDNLVQIAHNVRIGKHCVVAAQAGISGSTQFGDYCRVGGQAGFVGHIKIGDGAAFGAQSGVSSDVAPGETMSGSPARPHSLWKRMEAALPRLPELLRRVRRIEEHLGLQQSVKEENSER